ncbi:unnamed protein product [Onchocerca flexuosa]|uniref:H15 domain-containing protein n=1 Tax=Onchocerca flexuosa TaxID=387005 RepID=A0A183HUZ0_9BILA|nr:unnamed protein product [Onchocerca flexuosa]
MIQFELLRIVVDCNEICCTIQVNAHLRLGLKRGVASGILKQMKGTGASGSFRLADAKSEQPKKIKKRSTEKSASAGDMKMMSSKKSMKKKSSTKKMNSPKVSKPKNTPKKKAKAAGAGGASNPKSKKAAGRPKKAKASPVKSKTTKKPTVAHARNKKMAA